MIVSHQDARHVTKVTTTIAGPSGNVAGARRRDHVAIYRWTPADRATLVTAFTEGGPRAAFGAFPHLSKKQVGKQLSSLRKAGKIDRRGRTPKRPGSR